MKHKDFTVDDRPAFRDWTNLQHADMFSEWIDQEGEHWNDGPHAASSADVESTASVRDAKAGTSYEDLDPYFAITVAAAGWHSGALVLVDHNKAQHVRSKWMVQHEEGEEGGPVMPGAFEAKNDDEEYIWKQGGFPKVELPDGYVMPGVGESRVWRTGRPSMADLGLNEQQDHQ